MNVFLTLSPFLYAGIAIVGVVLTALVLFLLLREQKSIQAKDGTRFSSQEACNAYEAIYQRLETLYEVEGKESASQTKLGLSADFLQLLKVGGFGELKTLLIYQDDFKRLSCLFDDDSSK